jgi:hypothetical protein
VAILVLAENPSGPKSCGLTDVAMVQAADLRQFDDPPQAWWMDGPGLGCIAVQRQVAA